MFSKILLPLDGSDLSSQAVEHAKALAAPTTSVSAASSPGASSVSSESFVRSDSVPNSPVQWAAGLAASLQGQAAASFFQWMSTMQADAAAAQPAQLGSQPNQSLLEAQSQVPIAQQQQPQQAANGTKDCIMVGDDDESASQVSIAGSQPRSRPRDAAQRTANLRARTDPYPAVKHLQCGASQLSPHSLPPTPTLCDTPGAAPVTPQAPIVEAQLSPLTQVPLSQQVPREVGALPQES